MRRVGVENRSSTFLFTPPFDGCQFLLWALRKTGTFEDGTPKTEVGGLLEGEEFLEEGNGLRRLVGPMVTAGGFGGEVGAFSEVASAEPVKVGATDLELAGGIH